MIQYLVNDRLIFNTSQYLDPATTVGADFDINIENPLEPLGPVHRFASLCRGFFQWIRWFASSPWRYFRPKPAVGRKDAMESCQV